MFMPSLAFLGKSLPVDMHRINSASGKAARPFVLATLRSMLGGFAAKSLRAAMFLVMPFGSSEQPVPPRHMQQMLALMRRADDLESTEPEAAAELRWIAATCCHE
jgi:hypothetical protein